MFSLFKIKLMRQVATRTFGSSGFGILFDIDGVLIRGSHAIKEARQMFDLMQSGNFTSKIPIAFFTNSCDSAINKSESLSKLFEIPISKDQVINAPAPLKLFDHIHNKRTFFVSQHDVQTVAKTLNFTKPVSLEEIKTVNPTLDVMDKRIRVKLKSGYAEKEMDDVEVIVILGEPIQWESYLQIIIDLLLTGGQPLSSMAHQGDPGSWKRGGCEIYICNLDFLYTAEHPLPRFGNGAFIHSLESLYKKLTGKSIRYSSVIGKPSEVSYRYAENILSGLAQQLVPGSAPIERMYMIGDNPCSDILGANLYNELVQGRSGSLPDYRSIPTNVPLHPQTVKSVKSFLVTTGVFKPECKMESNVLCARYQHPVYSSMPGHMFEPTLVVDDCLEAFHRILELEAINTTAQRA